MHPSPPWHPLRNETLLEQLGGISEDLRLALQAARSLALELGSHYLGGEHLLYGLARGDSPIARRLRDLGLELSALRLYAESRQTQRLSELQEAPHARAIDPLDWLDPHLFALNPFSEGPLEAEHLDAALLLSQILTTKPVQDALSARATESRNLIL